MAGARFRVVRYLPPTWAPPTLPAIPQSRSNAIDGEVDSFHHTLVGIAGTVTDSLIHSPMGILDSIGPEHALACLSVFDAECRTPRHMQLVNTFCRYLELATVIDGA